MEEDLNTGLSPIESLSVRDRLAHANAMLDFSRTDTAEVLRAEIKWFAENNKNVALNRISRCEKKDEMVAKLDNLLISKGMNRLAIMLSDLFSPYVVEENIQSYTEELAEELEREEKEKDENSTEETS